jgi:hypothetical protein
MATGADLRLFFNALCACGRAEEVRTNTERDSDNKAPL